MHHSFEAEPLTEETVDQKPSFEDFLQLMDKNTTVKENGQFEMPLPLKTNKSFPFQTTDLLLKKTSKLKE